MPEQDPPSILARQELGVTCQTLQSQAHSQSQVFAQDCGASIASSGSRYTERSQASKRSRASRVPRPQFRDEPLALPTDSPESKPALEEEAPRYLRRSYEVPRGPCPFLPHPLWPPGMPNQPEIGRNDRTGAERAGPGTGIETDSNRKL